MLQPTGGQVAVDGTDIYALGRRDRARFRAQKIGFVFQLFHLIPYLSVLENVLLSTGTVPGGSGTGEVRQLLGSLNLLEREFHKPSELSAGERQRTAVARALINRPKLILADEPTGNLDPENAAVIIDCLAEYRNSGGTVIVATHGAAADRHADRIVYLNQGRIEERNG